MVPLMHLGYFLVPVVVKTVLQKRQGLEGTALTVEPHEKMIKTDNQGNEVLHIWCNVLYKFS